MPWFDPSIDSGPRASSRGKLTTLSLSKGSYGVHIRCSGAISWRQMWQRKTLWFENLTTPSPVDGPPQDPRSMRCCGSTLR